MSMPFFVDFGIMDLHINKSIRAVNKDNYQYAIMHLGSSVQGQACEKISQCRFRSWRLVVTCIIFINNNFICT